MEDEGRDGGRDGYVVAVHAVHPHFDSTRARVLTATIHSSSYIIEGDAGDQNEKV